MKAWSYARRLVNGGASWHVDYVEDGRRRSKTFKDQTAAETFRDARNSLALQQPAPRAVLPVMLELPAALPPHGSEIQTGGANPGAPLVPLAALNPLMAVLVDTYRKLVARGEASQHSENFARSISAVCRVARIDAPGSISKTAIELAIGTMRCRKVAGVNRWPWSAATANHALKALRGFCAWLESEQRLTFEQLRRVQEIRAFNVKRDKRRERTALTVVQFQTLCASVIEKNRTIYDIAPLDRQALYVGAAGTGRRSRAIRAMTVGQFVLNSQRPGVTTRGDQEKTEGLFVRISMEVAAYLRGYFAGKLPEARAFIMPTPRNVSRMLYADMIDAGITPFVAVKRDDGVPQFQSVLDFHSLRRTHAQWLADGGAPLNDLRRQTGHADLETLIDHYLSANADCVDRHFPRLSLTASPPPEPSKAQRRAG